MRYQAKDFERSLRDITLIGLVDSFDRRQAALHVGWGQVRREGEEENKGPSGHRAAWLTGFGRLGLAALWLGEEQRGDAPCFNATPVQVLPPKFIKLAS